MVCFGNRNYDDALIELRDLLESTGFRTVAAGAFVGEHSFSYTLGAGRPDAADIAKAEAFADEILALPEPPAEGRMPIEVNGAALQALLCPQGQERTARQYSQGQAEGRRGLH